LVLVAVPLLWYGLLRTDTSRTGQPQANTTTVVEKTTVSTVPDKPTTVKDLSAPNRNKFADALAAGIRVHESPASDQRGRQASHIPKPQPNADAPSSAGQAKPDVEGVQDAPVAQRDGEMDRVLERNRENRDLLADESQVVAEVVTLTVDEDYISVIREETRRQLRRQGINLAEYSNKQFAGELPPSVRQRGNDRDGFPFIYPKDVFRISVERESGKITNIELLPSD